MFHLPSWLKLNKNWVPSQAHIKEGWITVDIFRETATRKHRVSSYREIEHSEPLMIEDLKTHLFSYFINRKRYVFKDISSHFITSTSRQYNLSPQQVMGQYIDAGYLGKETTFQRDGLTVADTRYGLTSRALHEVKQLKEALVHKNNDWIEEMKGELNSLRELFRNEYTVEQQQLMDFVATRLKECQEEGKSHLCPTLSWNYSRDSKPGYYQKAIEFILSLLHCMYKAEVFDWKEIGSRLNPSIGASKQFDPIKDHLLNFLEQITQKEPEQLGIISLGSLYSVYISGSMAFETNHYSQAMSGDSVHCLSNIQIQQSF